VAAVAKKKAAGAVWRKPLGAMAAVMAKAAAAAEAWKILDFLDQPQSFFGHSNTEST
jgi:hypothetical protein